MSLQGMRIGSKRKQKGNKERKQVRKKEIKKRVEE